MRSGPRGSPVKLQRKTDLAALRHRLAGAADRVGSVKVPHRIGERCRIDGSRFSEGFPTGARYPIELGEDRMSLPHLLAQLAERLENQGMADGTRQGADDPPVLARFARREDGAARQLD